jgi:hypothetical protein
LAIGDGELWVSNQVGNSLSEIDPTTGAWIGRSGTAFDDPTAIVAFGADLFVANGAGSVTEAQASNGAFVRYIAGSAYDFDNPVAITTEGSIVLVVNQGNAPEFSGSVTEIDAYTGDLIRVVSGGQFSFDDPVAVTTSGDDAFIADEGSNSVTEIDATTGALVGVVSGGTLASPDGIAASGNDVWVADAATNSATEIDAATGTETYTIDNPIYGLGQPAATIVAGGSVYMATPYGTSPMVTRFAASSAAFYWYMCNTNGPYYFSKLSALAVNGDELWVASRTGDNNPTPGSATGSLTEMSSITGGLIRTLPG